MVRIATTIQLNEQQKRELNSIAQSRALSAGYVFRAKVILLLAEGRVGSELSRPEALSAHANYADQNIECHTQAPTDGSLIGVAANSRGLLR